MNTKFLIRSGTSFLSYGISGVGGLLLSFSLLQVLSLKDFGYISLAIVLAQFMALFVRGGISHSLTRIAAEDSDNDHYFIPLAFLLCVYRSLIVPVLIGLMLIALQYIQVDSLGLFGDLNSLILVSSFLGLAFISSISGYFKGKGKPVLASVFTLGFLFFSLAIVILVYDQIYGGINKRQLTLAFLTIVYLPVVFFILWSLLPSNIYMISELIRRHGLAKLSLNNTHHTLAVVAANALPLVTVLVSGLALSSEEVGLLRLVMQVLSIFLFSVMVIQSILSRDLLSFYGARRFESLNKIAQQSSRFGLCLWPLMWGVSLTYLYVTYEFPIDKSALVPFLLVLIATFFILMSGAVDQFLDLCGGHRFRTYASISMLFTFTAPLYLVFDRFGLWNGVGFIAVAVIIERCVTLFVASKVHKTIFLPLSFN